MLIIGTPSGDTFLEDIFFLTDGSAVGDASLFDKGMSKYLYDVYRFNALGAG